MKKLSTQSVCLLATILMISSGTFTAGHAALTRVEHSAMLAAGDETSEVSGVVTDASGEPLIGVNVLLKGTSQGVVTDLDGRYAIQIPTGHRAELVFSYVGYQTHTQVVMPGTTVNVELLEDAQMLEGVVVTAMGIVRKASSLTYATQQVKAADLMKVADPNLVNSLDGKISGVTLTPGAGGAGGATKIILRGNKSINGNNAPLIVVDGIPMSNATRGSAANFATQSSTEGSDPLSQINPDDIESINVLKGANAAALYGSQAANGVVMITTKKGKEGKLDISYNGNLTFDAPLLTPQIQHLYGSAWTKDAGGEIVGFEGLGCWGGKLSGETTTYIQRVNNNGQVLWSGIKDAAGVKVLNQSDVHMRNYAVDDVAAFYRTGITSNHSFSLSGGTEKMRSYVSYANSHALGLLENNSYDRHTFAYRQHYTFWNRLNIDASANYVRTQTKNRVGGGTALNPIYDLYTMPRNVDLDYYRNHYLTDGNWRSSNYFTYINTDGQKVLNEYARFAGADMQNWAFQTPMKNNPYFLMNRNTGVQNEDRFYGNFQGRLDIWEGLSAQARLSIDHTKYNAESHKSATSWDPAEMNAYGRYWLTNSKSNEIYTDYMLMYNKTFDDARGNEWLVNATGGYVGHVIKGQTVGTDVTATTCQRGTAGEAIALPLETAYNVFEPSAGGNGVTRKSISSNWDQAALLTAQVGWNDAVYMDASYRMDWYRAFKQARFQSGNTKAKDHYGYFGFGANAILSNLMTLPEEVSYLKYRVSYSEVGNSIPNVVFDVQTTSLSTGAASGSGYNSFTPRPETMKSFETGIESQFFQNALNFDLTYYNSTLDGAYLVVTGQNGKSQPVNTTSINNQGIEMTIGYDWVLPGKWRWKTGVNFSFNDNRINEVYTDEQGNEKYYDVSVAQGVKVRYKKGGRYGDMYVTDFDRWSTDCTDANGRFHKAGDIYIEPTSGTPSFGGKGKTIDAEGFIVDDKKTAGGTYARYLGNMNARQQLSWSNALSYGNLTLYFLVNGRIGGKVISITEAYLDRLGLSQRTADARLAAEADGLTYSYNDPYWGETVETGKAAMYINEGRDLVPIKEYYTALGYNDASSYVYDATNFRLRELSLGYTWQDLFGEGKNVSVSAIARNLFFLYRKAPVDPDVSLSTSNALGGFECFNLPSTRSFGIHLKANF
jgi:TonB-linked SusC/RagA family outer membrane protein